MMKEQKDYNVRAVERALQILECFDDRHPERGVSEISEEIGLHKSTTHRILTTLLNFGYIERAADGQKYRLGLRLTDLGFKVIQRMDLRREALPFMNQIVQEWDEACDLSIFDHGRVFYVEVLQSHHALTVSAMPGQRLPAHCTASGKVFLAHLPAETVSEVERHMTRYTPNTITSLDKLKEQLVSVRRQGYAVDDEEYELGLRAVSAPVFNRSGDILAAVSILSPSSRMSLERCQEIGQALIAATHQISQRLGWTG
jgi:IclR family transcriptional regulator, KDG regulon repressor